MKCPNCGAEQSGSYCSFCGSELPKQPVNIINNYYGDVVTNNSNRTRDNSGNGEAWGATCPSCGSSNVKYERESTTTRGIHRTIGLCKNCGNTWTRSCEIPTSPKNKVVAFILCILFGYLGAHYFYVGKNGMGWLYFFTLGLFGVGWLVDIIRIGNGSFTDARGYCLD